jgi:putative copper resistance protein D
MIITRMRSPWPMTLAAYAVVMSLLTLAAAQHASAQDHSMFPAQTGHEGMVEHTDDQMQMDASQMRMLMADKEGSEFNHHLAGIFIILAGFFTLSEGALSRRWSFFRFAWPSCFLLSGLFLLGYSDKELWPFGPQSWWYGMTHSLEVLQHKVFALILLAIGIIEVQRARGVFKAAWVKWVFPLLACFGSLMLLFHEHSGVMIGAGHMTAMSRIQTEHRGFAAAGFGIGIFKGFSELPTQWKEMFAKLWSSLVIVLGVLLLFYTE